MMRETCYIETMSWNAALRAVKKYFGHDPEYKPWTVVRYPHIPYPYIEGQEWDGVPIQGFVVSRQDLGIIEAFDRGEIDGYQRYFQDEFDSMQRLRDWAFAYGESKPIKAEDDGIR